MLPPSPPIIPPTIWLICPPPMNEPVSSVIVLPEPTNIPVCVDAVPPFKVLSSPPPITECGKLII